MSDIKLGSKVRDIVTGYEGIAVSRVEYMNGCVQYCIQAKCDKDGKVPDGHYFDFQRVETVESEPIKQDTAARRGADRNTPATAYRG